MRREKKEPASKFCWSENKLQDLLSRGFFTDDSAHKIETSQVGLQRIQKLNYFETMYQGKLPHNKPFQDPKNTIIGCHSCKYAMKTS